MHIGSNDLRVWYSLAVMAPFLPNCHLMLFQGPSSFLSFSSPSSICSFSFSSASFPPLLSLCPFPPSPFVFLHFAMSPLKHSAPNRMHSSQCGPGHENNQRCLWISSLQGARHNTQGITYITIIVGLPSNSGRCILTFCLFRSEVAEAMNEFPQPHSFAILSQIAQEPSTVIRSLSKVLLKTEVGQRCQCSRHEVVAWNRLCSLVYISLSTILSLHGWSGESYHVMLLIKDGGKVGNWCCKPKFPEPLCQGLIMSGKI